MENNKKIAIVLGIIILVADLLWLSGSFFTAGQGRFTSPYGNFTHVNYTHSNYTPRGVYPGFGAARYLDIVYGVVILIADLIWLFLEFSAKGGPAKSTSKRK